MSEIMKVDGLILAAGLSSRMNGFKPLLQIDGDSFVSCIARKMLPHCRQLFVVTGYRDADVREAVSRSHVPNGIEFIHNGEFLQGMFSSLQAGLRVTSGSEWVLCHWVDQPHIPAKFYADFVAQGDSNFDVVQPQSNGRLGHPLLLGATLMERIRNAATSATLRQLMERDDVKRKLWPCDYPQTNEDFDRPADVVRFLK